MKKWNLVIDVAKCFNCNCCTLACHDEYFDNDFPGYAAGMAKHGHPWIELLQRETGVVPMVEMAFLPVTCNHCDAPPCLEAARDGAVVKREDGIVIIHPEKARGQKQIVDACPYGAVFWNEEKQLPQAWPFDAHLLDQGWKKTRGSQVCPTKAMVTLHVDDEEMQNIVAAEGLEVLHPEFNTRPRIYYRNLHKFQDLFVGGAVAGEMAGVIECIADAQVSLKKNDQTLMETRTETFGEFKFEGLKPASGSYTLVVSKTGFDLLSINVEVQQESVFLSSIQLDRPRQGN